jgi:hypothetical protein
VFCDDLPERLDHVGKTNPRLCGRVGRFGPVWFENGIFFVKSHAISFSKMRCAPFSYLVLRRGKWG